MKSALKIILLLIGILVFPASSIAQDEMFRQKKERKRMWRRWKPNREAYNPYLKQKGKNKVSARMARANKKDLKRQKRAARKQMRKNKKVVNS